MTNIQASIGLAQLKKIDDILKRKSEIQKRYELGLKNLVDFQKILENTISSYWMCCVFFKTLEEKESVENALNAEDVETRPFFTPINKLPFYKTETNFKITNKVSSLGLILPSFPSLKIEEQNNIINIIKKNIIK